MSIERECWGASREGETIDRYVLTDSGGMKITVTTLGAALTSVETPDRDGRFENVTLALDSLEDYLRGHPCLGSVCGRYAGRIAKGRFTLDGVEYHLAVNNGANHLHGGVKGFHKVVWKAEPVERDGFTGVALTYQSADGEEGYPGALRAAVVYGLTGRNELRMEYTAVADRPTVVNLTNHAYWNLSGGRSVDVLAHELMIDADAFLEMDDGNIPTGVRKAVRGTPLDFTRPTALGARIGQIAGGYDHAYVLNKPDKKTDEPTLAARLADPASGRIMEVFTTEPALILYTANGFDGSLRAGGATYPKHAGACLETQHYPDAPNHADFPSTVLRPGEVYRQVTVHRFSTDQS